MFIKQQIEEAIKQNIVLLWLRQASVQYLSLCSWSFHPPRWPTVGSCPGAPCWQSSLPSPYSEPPHAKPGEVGRGWVSTVEFWMGSLGGSVLDYSYLFRLLGLKAHVFNCSNQKSLCPVPSENQQTFPVASTVSGDFISLSSVLMILTPYLCWPTRNWTDPDPHISIFLNNVPTCNSWVRFRSVGPVADRGELGWRAMSPQCQ